MSELMCRRRAINGFHNFLSQYLTPIAAHADAIVIRRAATRSVEVHQSEVLRVFFLRNPEHAPYRVDVADSLGGQKTFVLSKKRWTRTNADRDQ